MVTCMEGISLRNTVRYYCTMRCSQSMCHNLHAPDAGLAEGKSSSSQVEHIPENRRQQQQQDTQAKQNHNLINGRCGKYIHACRLCVQMVAW
jgi:hypothetical protein